MHIKSTGYVKPILNVFLSVSLCSCTSTEIIRDNEYQESTNELRRGQFSVAMQKMPTKEDGGFITLVERGWLSIWEVDDSPRLIEGRLSDLRELTNQLTKKSLNLESKDYIRISEEAKFFLWVRSRLIQIPGICAI